MLPRRPEQLHRCIRSGVSGLNLPLYDHALGALPANERYLIQPRLKAHEQLRRIMAPGGLGTVRVVTLRAHEGQYAFLSACLRITVSPNVTDNFSSGSAGNLTAAIDLASGALSPATGSRRREWPDMRTFDRHPDTQEAIAGRSVPLWGAVKDLALRAHAAFPELGAIGWDIAVTDAGPVLIEGNHAWDISLLQVAHRRGLRSVMYKALGGR